MKAANGFSMLLDATEAEIPLRGVLAGPARMNHEAARKKFGAFPWCGDDNLHFPMNVGTLLRLGLTGIEQTARTAAAKSCGEQAAYLRAIADCYVAAIRFVASHADRADKESALASAPSRTQRLNMIARSCRALTLGPPQSFLEALQLFWFAYVLRGRGTIGRIDQHLFLFYQADLDKERITRREAFELLGELWDGCNRAGSGDTLANIMLGGQDRHGRDVTNDLSLLILEATMAHKGTDPHVSARLHDGTPDAFRDTLALLQLDGRGKGTVFNDAVVIPALMGMGVSLEDARNYANNGCSEVIIDGQSTIGLFEVDALKSLELAMFNGQEGIPPGEPVGQYWTRQAPARRVGTGLHIGYASGDVAAMTAFDQIFEAYWDQYRHQLDTAMTAALSRINNTLTAGVSSPFLAGTFEQVLRDGTELKQATIRIDCVFSGSIPTAADGLMAIRRVVFEDKACTMAELLAALKADFVGHERLRLQLLAAPKFGNACAEVDQLAAEIARRYCRFVKSVPVPGGTSFWPCLFYHNFNDGAKIVCATPDGRRWNDPVAEHYSPVPGRARCGPTAVIRSATSGPLNETCGTAIFNLSLNRDLVPRNATGCRLIRHLTDSAVKLGAAQMNIAVLDVEALKAAKQEPDKHADLQVRVWGYSARFIDLADNMQDHIIARAIAGGGA